METKIKNVNRYDTIRAGYNYMKKVESSFLDKIDDDSYVWYACYGSNINLERLMIYINGDVSQKHANSYGCKDKSKPIDSKPYIIKKKIYFANYSQGWNGGVAFLNYRARGTTYGKIYKLKKSQFLDIYKQEHRLKDYDTVLYIGKHKRTPIFTFTSQYKLNNIEKPSKEYLDVIRKGIEQTYKNKTKKQIDKYISRISN